MVRLADDLNALRPHMQDAEEAWLALLVGAHDWTAWTPTNSVWIPHHRAAQQVNEDLARLTHLELRHSWSFDRADEVRARATACGATPLPAAVVTLIRAMVATHGDPTVAEVVSGATAVLADSHRSLSALPPRLRGR